MACGIPYMRHLLGRIRKVKDQCMTNNKSGDKVGHILCTGLALAQRFPRQARDGVSMNLLTHRYPNVWLRSDICERGIGVMNVNTAVGWHWLVPNEWRLKLTLDMTEFLASVVGIWFEMLLGGFPVLVCIFAESESTTATGWIYTSNFVEEDQHAVFGIARHLGDLLLDANMCLYSHWFTGKDNLVMDLLSRDLNLDDEELTALLVFALPDQVPPHLKFNHLPKEISSFLTSLFRDSPGTQRQSLIQNKNPS
jgi:hypothetical protein